MYKTSRAETPFDPTIPERPGWEGMYVHWLADRDHGHTATAVFNVTQFPPKRSHELHRHPDAEEYFFVLEGPRLHLTDGDHVELQPGDLVFIPKAEWPRMTRLLIMGGTGVLGRALLPLAEAAGHEVHAPSRAELDLFDRAAAVCGTPRDRRAERIVAE